MAVLLAAYPIVSLSPFDWTAPTVLSNAAVRLPAGGVSFRATGIARSDGHPAWIAGARRSDSLDIRLRVRATDRLQHGPARLLTVSKDPWHRNLTIGQDGGDLVLRLRTPWSDTNGMPEIHVSRVFDLPAWVDVRVVVEPESLRVLVDGERRLERALPPHALAPWDPAYAVALGNELTYDRPWIGDIEHAIIAIPDTAIDYAGRDGPVVLPERLWLLHRPPQLIPLRGASPWESALNVLFYVPLGVLLGSVRLRRRYLLPRILAAVALSAGLETLQLLIPSRQPSVNDVIMNAAGAALGLLFAGRIGGRSASRISPKRV